MGAAEAEAGSVAEARPGGEVTAAEPAAVLLSLGTAADIVRLHARRRPDREAVIFGDRRTTWAELDRRTERMAAALAAEGIGRSSRVAWLGKNSDHFVVALFGAARAGVVLAPVNWRLTPAETAFVLEDCEAELLFVTADHLPLAAALTPRPPRVRRIVAVDSGPDPPAGVVGFEAWLAAAPAGAPSPGAAEDVVVQIYSSGTTGRPKGVELTNRNLISAVRHTLSGWMGEWSPRDLHVITLPLFHAGAIVCLAHTLFSGGTVLVMPDAAPAALLEAARRLRITKASFAPAQMQLLIEAPGFDPKLFADLDLIVYGGSPITPSLLLRLLSTFDCGFVQPFGSSETFTIGTALTPADHAGGDPARLASCGRPLPGVGVRVVDPEGGDLAPGEVGEILIASASVMKGYWRMPEATAEVLRDGWYHSGDLGTFDADGYLHIRGRSRDLIISGGENVYPVEVENALAEHPAVAEVSVVGVPDSLWGEAVTAVVVVADGAGCEPEDLVAFARRRIAAYKCPRHVVFQPSLPKNPAGKVLKRELRDALLASYGP